MAKIDAENAIIEDMFFKTKGTSNISEFLNELFILMDKYNIEKIDCKNCMDKSTDKS